MIKKDQVLCQKLPMECHFEKNIVKNLTINCESTCIYYNEFPNDLCNKVSTTMVVYRLIRMHLFNQLVYVVKQCRYLRVTSDVINDTDLNGGSKIDILIF